MRWFKQISSGIDTAPLAAQLGLHPELWGANGARTFKGSPHEAVEDIWVRFRPKAELTSADAYREPHFAEWWPAANVLPAVKPIINDLMHDCGAVYLGGVLITRLPPGGAILPHDDRGSWHAEYLDCKVYVPIQSDTGCLNFCADECMEMAVGTAWSFDNLVTHSVENRSDRDRINMIVCMRVG